MTAPVREQRRRWSLATALTWGASAGMATAILVVMVLSLRAGVRSAEDLVTTWAVAVVESVTGRLAEHLEPARSQSVQMAAVLAASDLPREQIAALLGASLAAAPQLGGTVFVSVEGWALGVRRGPSGATERFEPAPGGEMIANHIRFAQATARRGTREGQWGEVVPGVRGGDAVVNHRQPVWRGERLVGVLTSGVRTSHLARYLEQIAAPSDAVAFILLGQDEVVAASSLDMRTVPRADDDALPRLDAVPDPALRAMWKPLDTQLNANMPRVPGFDVHVQETDTGVRIGYVTQYVYGLGPTPWLVGCYFRGEHLRDALWRIRGAAVAGLAVVLAAALATFFAGRALSRPIMRLARAAQAVQSGGPGAAEALPRSPLREVDTASGAFNAMVEGLRERERMRKTFGRYVPASIAEELLADDGVLQPQTRVCTTLFTDIVGYSTISEQLSPVDLIAMLNEYFSVVVDPIESHGGVIHQFQGDAILATYNLPVADEDHAAQAIRSALKIQRATRGQIFGPGVELATRIGINTGPAVCGTVGAADRLGFTVHGDDVNLAARIEEMNKTLGTRILVAESTVRRAGDAFEFTEVGKLAVRGRRQDVTVYRVAGPHRVDERSPGS